MNKCKKQALKWPLASSTNQIKENVYLFIFVHIMMIKMLNHLSREIKATQDLVFH